MRILLIESPRYHHVSSWIIIYSELPWSKHGAIPGRPGNIFSALSSEPVKHRDAWYTWLGLDEFLVAVPLNFTLW